MGDRVHVMLEVLSIHAETVESIDDSFDYQEEDNGITAFNFTEVNYGELSFLSELEHKGISYSASWSSGCEFSAGCKSCRFTADGQKIIKEIYENHKNPSLQHLTLLLDNYTALREYIEEFAESIKVLPWDNQEEYGKIYLTKQLLRAAA